MADAVPPSQGVGRCLAGRFVLEDRIGQGGMGEVYRARHLELNTAVAVKLLSRRLQAQQLAIRRFRREARSAARLRSAHIVQVFDFGVDAGVPFLVMELLQGESLAARVNRVHRVDLRTAAAWVEQAAHGLAVAHAHGVVHRDVKPSNLFLVTDGSREILKILDFGVAKPQDEDDDDGAITGARMLVGSPLYMSPEQASGGAVDARTDVWALGAVAFRLLTGQDAFAAASTNQVLATIRSGSPPSATRLVPNLPGEVDAFFRKALAWNVEQRFRTVQELASAFSCLAAQPKTTTPAERSGARSSTTQPFLPVEPAFERVTPPSRRRAAVTLLALLTLAVALLVGGALGARRDRREAPSVARVLQPASRPSARERAQARSLTNVAAASIGAPHTVLSARPRAVTSVRPSPVAPAPSLRRPRSRPLAPPVPSVRAAQTDPLFGL